MENQDTNQEINGEIKAQNQTVSTTTTVTSPIHTDTINIVSQNQKTNINEENTDNSIKVKHENTKSNTINQIYNQHHDLISYIKSFKSLKPNESDDDDSKISYTYNEELIKSAQNEPNNQPINHYYSPYYYYYHQYYQQFQQNDDYYSDSSSFYDDEEIDNTIDPKPTNVTTDYVFVTDPQTGGLVYVPASSLTSTINTIPATILTKPKNLIPETKQEEVTETKTKKKKSKKKGWTITWLYPIMDKEKNSFVSLCRGQIRKDITKKWLACCKNDDNWNGNEILNRSHVIGDMKPFFNWYTKQGCSCTLIDNKTKQNDNYTNMDFPEWLNEITDEIKMLCGFKKNDKNKKIDLNCCELVFFNRNDQGWDWHNDETCIGSRIFESKNNNKELNRITIHLIICGSKNKKLFKFAPKKTCATGGDKEVSLNLEDGDMFITSGSFQSKYMIKIEPNEKNNDENQDFCYIVWRQIINHAPFCSLR